MSGLLALVKPRPIKASHRRRGKVASGPIVQRYYDPGIGSFLSVDPVSADAAGGTNFNRYRYAANNPYAFIDPDGRRAIPKGECGSESCPEPTPPPEDPEPSRRERQQQRQQQQDMSLGAVIDGVLLNPKVVNSVAGFGDGVSSALTLSLYSTADAREDMSINGGVDLQSDLYGTAKFAGQVQGSLTGGAALAKGLTKLSNIQQLRWVNQNRYLRFGPGKPGPGMPKVDMMRIGPSPWNIATKTRAWWTHWRL